MTARHHSPRACLVDQRPRRAAAPLGPCLNVPVQPDPADGQLRSGGGEARLAHHLGDAR
jgi:hypothetical protein